MRTTTVVGCIVLMGLALGAAPARAQLAGFSYQPPLRGAPSSATRVGGGTRSLSARRFDLSVLVPDHVGLTTREQPTLYWFVSEPIADAVEFTVIDPESLATLLEIKLPVPIAPGIHAVSLAEHAVRLAPGVIYQWFVAVIPDPDSRSADVVAAGEIQRVAGPADLPAGGDVASRAERFAAAGIWYDALDGLSRRIARQPGDAALHGQRAALLEQVGLERAAAYERGAR